MPVKPLPEATPWIAIRIFKVRAPETVADGIRDK